MHQFVRNCIARLVYIGRCITVIIIVVTFAADCNTTDMILICSIIGRDTSCACGRNRRNAIQRNWGDIVIFLSVRLRQCRQQVPVVFIRGVKRNIVSFAFINYIMIWFRFTESVCGLVLACCDIDNKSVQDVTIFNNCTICFDDRAAIVPIRFDSKFPQSHIDRLPFRIRNGIWIVVSPVKNSKRNCLRICKIKIYILLIVVCNSVSVLVLCLYSGINRISVPNARRSRTIKHNFDLISRQLYSLKLWCIGSVKGISSQIRWLGHCSGSVVPPVAVRVLFR